MNPLAVASSITAVTVFRKGASVTRTAEVSLPGPGRHQVKLAGLPNFLVDGSVRVALPGQPSDAGGWKAGQVEVNLETYEAASGLPPAKSEALKAAEQAETLLKARIAHLGKRLELVKRLGPLGKPTPEEGKRPEPFHLEARLELIRFRDEQLALLEEQHRELSDQLREATEQRKDQAETDRKASTDRQTESHALRKSLTVLLSGEVASEHPVTLEVTYRVPDASWAPSYVARTGKDYAKTRLEMRAIVEQRTGEDWNRVNLRLASADPQSWAELPELKSRRIGRRQPEPARVGWRPPVEGIDSLFADRDQTFGKPAPGRVEARSTYSEITRGGSVREEGEHVFAEAQVTDYMEAYLEESPGPYAVGAVAAGGGPTRSAAAAAAKPAAAAPAGETFRVKDKKRSGRPSIAERRARLREPVEPTNLELSVAFLNYLELHLVLPNELGRGEPSPRPAAHPGMARQETKLPAGFKCPSGEWGFDHVFETAAPADIPSDGAYHNLPVMDSELSSTLVLVCVPREDQQVYRQLRITNGTGAPVLAGPVDVYREGHYVVTGRIENVPKDASLELALGVEQGARVARNTQFEESTNLVGKLNLRHRIRIELVSNLAFPADYEIRERVPVKENDEKRFDVQVERTEPAWAEFQQQRKVVRGTYRWTGRLASGGREEFLAEYVVQIPSRTEIVEGNRRES